MNVILCIMSYTIKIVICFYIVMTILKCATIQPDNLKCFQNHNLL